LFISVGRPILSTVYDDTCGGCAVNIVKLNSATVTKLNIRIVFLFLRPYNKAFANLDESCGKIVACRVKGEIKEAVYLVTYYFLRL
jgi:hypothetical protein